MENFLSAFFGVYIHPGVILGLSIELLIIFFFSLLVHYKPYCSLVVFFDFFFDSVYDFFEDLLGVEEKRWIKVYITSVFFIILFSNLLGVFLDFLLPIFGEDLEHYIHIPTADINFNIGMAVVSLVIVLSEQFKHLGIFHFFHEYFPIKGKGYIPYEKGILPKGIDAIVFIVIKFFDIIISLFLGVLEIIGLFAKIISLSFRLFGNVTSGSILLMMLVVALSAFTDWVFKINFPIVFPLLVYIQGILVAFIQAFVFPLLVAIFIKVAKLH